MTKSSLAGSRVETWRRVAVPLAASVLAGAFVLTEFRTPKALEAGNRDVSRPDADGDGVLDSQEVILGTSPDSADTDGDGFNDLEELARRSNPLDGLSLPGPEPLGVGMFAETRNDKVALSTALFVQAGNIEGLNFDIGLVIDGVPVVLTTATYGSSTKAFLYQSDHNPANRIIVLEMQLPAALVTSMGRLELFARLIDNGVLGRPPAVDVTELADFSGVVMRIENAPPGMPTDGGIIYRPLSGDGSIPTTWSAGQICWQRTTPVGMNGANVVYEVDQADCQDMDTYCSSSDCSASVGQPLERPDPGALLGG